MKWASRSESQRRRVVIATILIVGLGAALAVYWTAQSPAANPLGDPEDSKRYLRDMQQLGGTANLLAGEMREWFDSLWHGERLALTIAVLSLLSAGGYWFAVTRLRLEAEPETPASDETGGPVTPADP